MYLFPLVKHLLFLSTLCDNFFALGKPFDVVAFFNNPLNATLTDLEWIVEGAGLMKPNIFKTTE